MTERNRQFDALRAAAAALTTELDLPKVLQGVVDQARSLVNARYAALGVLTEDGSEIEQFITSGIESEVRARIGPVPRGRGLLGVIIRDAIPLRISSIAADPRSAGFPANHPPMHTLLGVPIVSKGKVYGNLYLTDKWPDLDVRSTSPDGPDSAAYADFTAADQEVVELFAMTAAIAIENAKVHRQGEQLAIARERERIAMDLHDGIIQSIYAVGLTLDDARYRFSEDPDVSKEQIEQSIHDLNDVIADIRNYIMGLETGRLGDRSIDEGLSELARELRANSFMTVQLDLDASVPPLLTREQVRELLHIAKEGLSNVRKHARATHTAISLKPGDGAILLEIQDNGVGFEPARAGTDGNGLRNMQRRAEQIGARLTIEARSQEGACLRVVLPSPGSE